MKPCRLPSFPLPSSSALFLSKLQAAAVEGLALGDQLSGYAFCGGCQRDNCQVLARTVGPGRESALSARESWFAGGILAAAGSYLCRRSSGPSWAETPPLSPRESLAS